MKKNSALLIIAGFVLTFLMPAHLAQATTAFVPGDTLEESLAIGTLLRSRNPAEVLAELTNPNATAPVRMSAAQRLGTIGITYTPIASVLNALENAAVNDSDQETKEAASYSFWKLKYRDALRQGIDTEDLLISALTVDIPTYDSGLITFDDGSPFVAQGVGWGVQNNEFFASAPDRNLYYATLEGTELVEGEMSAKIRYLKSGSREVSACLIFGMDGEKNGYAVMFTQGDYDLYVRFIRLQYGFPAEDLGNGILLYGLAKDQPHAVAVTYANVKNPQGVLNGEIRIRVEGTEYPMVATKEVPAFLSGTVALGAKTTRAGDAVYFDDVQISGTQVLRDSNASKTPQVQEWAVGLLGDMASQKVIRQLRAIAADRQLTEDSPSLVQTAQDRLRVLAFLATNGIRTAHPSFNYPLPVITSALQHQNLGVRTWGVRMLVKLNPVDLQTQLETLWQAATNAGDETFASYIETFLKKAETIPPIAFVSPSEDEAIKSQEAGIVSCVFGEYQTDIIRLKPGVNTFTKTTTDEEGTTITKSLTLNFTNRPPALTSLWDRIVDSGTPVHFGVTATDPDPEDTELDYLAEKLPAGATFDPATHTFSWNDPQIPGDYAINFGVFDGGLADEKEITISVIGVDQPRIIGISPPVGKPMDDVSINGSKFGASAGRVEFPGGANGLIQSWSDTQVRCQVPASVKSGKVYVIDGDGRKSNGSSFYVPPSCNAVGAVNALTSASTMLFARYTDVDGGEHITDADLLFNTSLSYPNAAWLRYDQKENLLYLRNDDNTAWLGGETPGSATVIENSAVRIDCAETSVMKSGVNLTIRWALQFKVSFAGDKNIYLYVADANEVSSFWQEQGTINIDNPPSVVSVSPAAGKFFPDVPTTFRAAYADPEGYEDIATASLLINDSPNPNGGLYAMYSAVANQLALYEGNTLIGSAAPGSSTILESATGKLYCASTTVSGSGTTVTVNWNISFSPNPAFNGDREIYLSAHDRKIGVAPWRELGNIVVRQPDTTPPPAPQVTLASIFARPTLGPLPAIWSATDPDSDIIEYRYLIMKDSPTGTVYKDWTSAGTNTTTTLALPHIDGKAYYLGVQAKNESGLWSATGFSPACTVDNQVPVNCSIRIDNGAAYAAYTAVTLSLAAQDATSGIAKMCFSNNAGKPGETWSTPEPYATIKPWTLTTGVGLKTVTVKFTDGAGYETWAQATITMQRPPVALLNIPHPIGAATLTVTCDGNRSYDSDGRIVSYFWNFGDGSIMNDGPAFLSHRYTREGVYMLTLGVTDDKGGRASTHCKITVYPATGAIYVHPQAIGTAPFAVQFIPILQETWGRITYCHWTFGDFPPPDDGSDSRSMGIHTYENRTGAAQHYTVLLDYRTENHHLGRLQTVVTVNPEEE